jgi:hypothetical protein
VAGEDIRTFDKREWAYIVSLVNQVFTLQILHNLVLQFVSVDMPKAYFFNFDQGSSIVFGVSRREYSIWFTR